MSSAYLSIYKRAATLYKEGKVQLTNEKDNVFYFDCNGHSVSLQLRKVIGGWERAWGCDCVSNALHSRLECSHIKASELFLMSGGYNGKNKDNNK